MSRRPTPTVNASLIHEARMIIQQFLGHRQNIQTIAGIARPQKRHVCNHTVLKCSFCTSEAQSVINGHSACALHETKARGLDTMNVTVNNPSQV